MVSAVALTPVTTLPVIPTWSSVTVRESALAVIALSRICTVSVPLAEPPPKSLTVRAMVSVLSVAPGWLKAAFKV